MAKIKKGQPFLYLVFILAIFIIGLAYVIIDQAVVISHNKYYNDSYLTSDQDYQNFYIRSQTVWDWLPLIIATGLIIWILIKIKEKSQYADV